MVLPSFAQDAPVVDFVPTTATPVQIDSASLIAIPVLIGSQGPQVHFVDDIVSETGVDLLGVVVAATELDDAHPGSFVEIPVSSGLTEGQSLRSILLFGVDEGSPGQLRNAAGALARRTRGHREVTVCLRALDDDEQLRAFVEGFVLGDSHSAPGSSNQAPLRRSSIWFVRSRGLGSVGCWSGPLCRRGLLGRQDGWQPCPPMSSRPGGLPERSRAWSRGIRSR